MLKNAVRLVLAVALGLVAAVQVTAPPAQAAPAAVSLRLTTPVPIVGETSHLAGGIGVKAATKVYPQRWNGRAWVTLFLARSLNDGRYTFSFKAAAPTRLRVFVPAHKVGRTTYPARYSPVVTVTPVLQTLTLSSTTAPVVAGQSVTTRVQVTPTRAGRFVDLERLDAGRWTRVASLPQSTAGRAFPAVVVPEGTGPVVLRAVSRPQGGAGTAVSATINLTRYVPPAEDDSFLSVVEQVSSYATSGDGSVVVFSGQPTRPDGSRAPGQVYVHLRATGETRLLSGDGDGAPSGWSMTPTVSADGSTVAFVTESPTVAQQQPVGHESTQALVVHDIGSGVSRTITRRGDVAWPERAERPSLSADGTRVAFRGWFFNEERTTWSPYLSVVDLPTGELTVARRAAWNSAISGNGRFVAYDAEVPIPWGQTSTRWVYQVFRFDVETGAEVLVSQTPSGDPGHFPSTDPSIDATGDRIAFLTEGNEVQGAPSGALDVNVVVADISTSTYRWLGGDIVRARSFTIGPLLSSDGRTLAYVAHPGIDKKPRLVTVRVADGARVEQPAHPTAEDRRYLEPVALFSRPDGIEVLTLAQGRLERVLVPLR
ncbi:hypothetical protein [Nocardioides zeae]|uniref:Tol biopolymer transport system component n=1 Tax=Nocardioides zeae TaxID=1457234 RepID=A0AAJ1U2V6_9ACTN|nr:hypothetical protein [Nocardioides zeae]MDQ1106364.1 Tol biopolymer transport system component [Nocardioides zeae]